MSSNKLRARGISLYFTHASIRVLYKISSGLNWHFASLAYKFSNKLKALNSYSLSVLLDLTPLIKME